MVVIASGQYTASGRRLSWRVTCLSWNATLLTGVSKLVMRSLLKGNAQLPLPSGTQAKVL
jgi:hypothetical protein